MARCAECDAKVTDLTEHWETAHPPDSVYVPVARPPAVQPGRKPNDPEKLMRPADDAAKLVGVDPLLLDEWLCAHLVDGVWDEIYGWWTTGKQVRAYLTRGMSNP